MTDKKILIVDDNIALCDNLEDILREQGYKTNSAHTCADGLRRAIELRPHVAVLDLKLPDGLGTELMAEMKNIDPDCVCIIATAFADVESAIRALQLGAFNYLYKPVRPDELMLILDRAFEMINLRSSSRQATARFRESEELYRTLVDNIPLGISLIGRDYRIIMTNETHAEMFGQPKEWFVGKQCHEVFEHRQETCAHCPGKVSMATAALSTACTAGFRQDGSRFDVHIYSVPLMGDSNEPYGFIEIVEDITERKRAEEAVRATQELFTLFMKHTPVYTFIKQIEGEQSRIVQISDNFIDMVGKPAEELRGRTMDEVFPADFARKITADDLAIVAAGKMLQVDEEFNDRHYTTIKFPIFREGDNNLLAGFTIDVTERTLAEQKLQLSEQKFSTIFNLMPDMVGITRMADGCFIEVNDRFERWTGWKREEALGKSSLDLGVWDHKARAEAVAILQEQGHLEEFEFIMRTKSGELRAALMYLLPIIVQDEKCLFFLARDVTEHKRAVEERIGFEKQLLHAQKLESLGVLAGGIAHDFNNILTAIIGNAEMALLRLNPESPALENLVRIEKAAARAADLARQMLAYSGKGKFVVEAIDVNRLVEEMGHMLAVSISKKVVLRYNLTKPLPAVNVDATQIRQIIMNLVINASEAISDQSGVIAITTGFLECTAACLQEFWLTDPIPAGLYVSLEIADSGCGMDKETLDRIFDPFFTTKFTGRGLGMAAVLGIVRSHKGAIKVYSEPGKGSSFKVLLPAGEKSAELLNGKAAADNWQGSGTALLVDDEETVRAIGAEMLKELGFDVITANDGCEAVERFKTGKEFSVVILDLTMPHMDGEQCFRELRQLDPNVKVIICSGFSEHEVTQKFVGKGLAGFVQKPYKLSVLSDVMREVFLA